MFRIYSTPICPECARLKQFLLDRGIEFEEVNVLEDRDAANFIAGRTGMRRVPVFQADEIMVIGFNKPEIEKLLKNC